MLLLNTPSHYKIEFKKEKKKINFDAKRKKILQSNFHVKAKSGHE
jgi:hypothetical protein